MNDSTLPRAMATEAGYKNLGLQLMLVVLASAIGCGGAIFLYQSLHKIQSKGAEESNSWLVVSEEELDLGRVYETNFYPHVLHITNRSDQPVTITKFETTCDCLGITPDTDVALQPHETKAFTVKLSLVKKAGYTGQWEDEPFEVRLGAVYSTDGQNRHSAHWRLNCVIVPTIRLKPFTIQLGIQSDRQSTIEQSVSIEATNEVQGIDYKTPPGWVVEIIRDQASSSPRKFQAVVRSQGKLTPQRVSDVIRLYPLVREGGRLPSKELKIEGEIVHDVVASPREIHHGRQPCGTTANEAIRLVSLTNRPFRVKNAASRSNDLEVARIVGEGEDWIYSLQLRFTKPGAQEVMAEFVIQDEDGVEYGIVVPVRYHGLAGP